MKPRNHTILRNLFNLIFPLNVTIAIGLNACSFMPENSFDSQKWQNRPQQEGQRMGMLKDLYRKFDFKSQTSDEVKKVL